MSNKVEMEVKADVDEGFGTVRLNARGSFCVYYTKRSEINAMLDTKDKERFLVTIERVKK